VGQWIKGTFTADSTSQSLQLSGALSATDGYPQINALQLRTIPEPSSALLGGLGLLALFRRRRA
jgi:hypothetical protein